MTSCLSLALLTPVINCKIKTNTLLPHTRQAGIVTAAAPGAGVPHGGSARHCVLGHCKQPEGGEESRLPLYLAEDKIHFC